MSIAEDLIDDIAPDLTPEELDLSDAWAEPRRKTFAAGRTLARQALKALGERGLPILRTADRAPIWPSGICGSISHTSVYAIAAVARSSEVTSIGIDVENIGRFKPKLDSHIMTPGEITRELAGLDEIERQIRTAAIFSAKESFYKFQHPLTGVRLGFHAAEVRLDRQRGQFEVMTCTSTSAFPVGAKLNGIFAVKDEQVATLIWQRQKRAKVF